MWTCPRCGRAFANRNQSHACGDWTLEDHLRDASPEVGALVRRFVALVEQCGPVDVVATKTRIGFKVRMTFAALMPKRRWVDAHVVLARRREGERFRRIDTFGPRSHVHAFRLVEPGDLDAEVLDWLREAYAVGRQEHLARK
jgi:Domain of unknown function (DUF5655)